MYLWNLSQEALIVFVVVCLVIAVLCIVIAVPLAVVSFRKPEPPIDWHRDDAALYRREAILRDRMADTVIITRTGDRRRKTSVTAKVLSNIPPLIAPLPVKDPNL